MKVYLCACVPEEDRATANNAEEKEGLLQDAAALLQKEAPKLEGKTVNLQKEAFTLVSSSLDVFKGLLCILMVYSHVDLCLVNPTEVYYGKLGHFVGNAASGMCFLGFMFSYGYTCYWAYLSDLRPRPFSERLERVARSAILPIIGAWVCSFAWSFMCFKIPITYDSVVGILTFYYVWGNGPDFLLSFTALLLVSFAMRKVFVVGLTSDGTTNGRVRFALTAFAMLAGPMLLTKCVVADCTGYGRYWQFVLPCDKREPVGMANLPALPHFFYFNLGVLAAVGTHNFGEALMELRTLPLGTTGAKSATLFSVLAGGMLVLNVVLAVLAYPLYDQWWQNFGNIAVPTKFGEIIRGWSRGPSPLWLLGNLWWVYTLFLVSLFWSGVARYGPSVQQVLRVPLSWFEHLGANVLIYLVVSDCMLAGLYRGNQFPLTAVQGGYATLMILASTRFIHYLGASGRK